MLALLKKICYYHKANKECVFKVQFIYLTYFTKNTPLMQEYFNKICRSGETGRRAGLKIQW
jgi:hypothetical protein